MPQLIGVLFVCFTCLHAQLQTIQVNLLYRHGDRSALKSFPKDVNQEKAWPQGFGQLSKVGMQQHYELGGYLRERYKQLLSSSYTNREVNVRSTDIDRTLMSAYSHLAGFYPPSDSRTFNSSLRWQPIPVHTVPNDIDVLLGLADCVRYDKLVDMSIKSDEFIHETERYGGFFKALSQLSGAVFHDIFMVQSLYDTVFCEVQHNLSVPNWLTWTNITGDGSVAFETMRLINDLLFKISFDSREKQRLTAGTLVGRIRRHMDAMARGASFTPKMYMYSAHDTTVASLLSALNVFDGQQPRYTATVMVELQKDTTSRHLYVAIFYKNGVNVSEPVRLRMPGCDDPCPLAKFKELTADVVPTDWDSECRNTGPLLTKSKPLLTKTEIIAISVCACVMLCLVTACIICYTRRKKASPGYNKVPSAERHTTGHP